MTLGFVDMALYLGGPVLPKNPIFDNRMGVRLAGEQKLSV